MFQDALNAMLASGRVVNAVIIGLDGSILAISPQFKVSPQEAQAMVAGIADPSLFQAGGIYLNGVKYLCLRAMPDEEVNGKKGPSGLYAVCSYTAIAVGVHDEKTLPQECSVEVHKQADKLREQGY